MTKCKHPISNRGITCTQGRFYATIFIVCKKCCQIINNIDIKGEDYNDSGWY